jgi:lipopolysaccharide export system protein LptA
MSESERRRQLLAAVSALGLSLGITVEAAAAESPTSSGALAVQTDQVKVNSSQDKVRASTVKLNTGQVKVNSAQDKVNACCIKLDSTQQKGYSAPAPQ